MNGAGEVGGHVHVELRRPRARGTTKLAADSPLANCWPSHLERVLDALDRQRAVVRVLHVHAHLQALLPTGRRRARCTSATESCGASSLGASAQALSSSTHDERDGQMRVTFHARCMVTKARGRAQARPKLAFRLRAALRRAPRRGRPAARATASCRCVVPGRVEARRGAESQQVLQRDDRQLRHRAERRADQRLGHRAAAGARKKSTRARVAASRRRVPAERRVVVVGAGVDDARRARAGTAGAGWPDCRRSRTAARACPAARSRCMSAITSAVMTPRSSATSGRSGSSPPQRREQRRAGRGAARRRCAHRARPPGSPSAPRARGNDRAAAGPGARSCAATRCVHQRKSSRPSAAQS